MSIATIHTGVARTDHTTEAIRKLRVKLEAYHRRRARRAGWTMRFVPTGLAPLDAALPHGGLPCGTVTEILADHPGAGSMSLAMWIARHMTKCVGGCAGSPETAEDGRSTMLIDTPGDFYPPAAWQQGIAKDRLIVLRVRNEQEAFWAVDQSLRCPAVATVIAPLNGLDERLSRRLQLAAESSGSLGLILVGGRLRRKSFAAVRMFIEGVNPVGPTFQSVERQAGKPVPQPDAAADMRSMMHTNCGIQVASASGGPAQTEDGGPPSGPCRFPMGWNPPPPGDGYLCRITLLTALEQSPSILVDLHHETGAWPVHSVPVDRPAAKTG